VSIDPDQCGWMPPGGEKMDMDDTSTAAADGDSFARCLSTGLEVKPTDFLDGWWLHEAARADHSEFTYAFRHTALGELEPTTLDELLPEGAEVVRRAFFTSATKQELVVAYEETLVAMSVESSYLWLAVAARDAKDAAYVKDAPRRVPRGRGHPRRRGQGAPRRVDGRQGDGAGRRPHQRPEGPPVAGDPPQLRAQTGAALAGLFDGFEPGKGGGLLLWHGFPGTGKSHALGALAHAWRSWCAIHYVADPEDLLGDSDYLLSVTLHPVKTPRAWKLVILEDTASLGTAGARDTITIGPRSNGSSGCGCDPTCSLGTTALKSEKVTNTPVFGARHRV
jgi:hypothetical protein